MTFTKLFELDPLRVLAVSELRVTAVQEHASYTLTLAGLGVQGWVAQR